MSDPHAAPEPQGPLTGVRVLDLSNLLAAPMATMLLGDFGAEVFKVEHPVKGDGMRTWGQKKDGFGLFFKVVNRNKKTITIDLHTTEGQELVRRIVKELDIDVVVENYRTGTLEKWGLGYDDFRAVKPDVIMLHVTGYGRTGPMQNERALGTVLEAFSGVAYMNGYADRPPMLPPFGIGDTSTAVFAALAITMALYKRNQGGGGENIDLALYEGMFTMMGALCIDYDQLGFIRERGELANVVPRGTFETKDGRWIALSGGSGKSFELIAETIGISWVMEDERYNSNQVRIQHANEIDDIVREAIKQITYDELFERQKATGAPFGPVQNIAQIFENEQFKARDNIFAIDDPDLGTIRMQNVVPKLQNNPGRIRFSGAAKGAFNEELFERLGLSEDEVKALHDAGAV